MLYRHELFRKAIHLFGIFWLFPILTFDSMTASLIYGCIFGLLMILECFRIKQVYILGLNLSSFGALFRDGEKHKKFTLKSMDQLILGLLIMSIFFDQSIVISCYSMMIFGDAFAAIIGRKIGRYKMYKNKTLEGFVAFVFFATIGSYGITNLLGYQQSFEFIIIISIFAALIELFDFYKKYNIDDNIMIPISCCIVCSVLF